jgi:hypothetical protein
LRRTSGASAAAPATPRWPHSTKPSRAFCDRIDWIWTGEQGCGEGDCRHHHRQRMIEGDEARRCAPDAHHTTGAPPVKGGRPGRDLTCAVAQPGREQSSTRLLSSSLLPVEGRRRRLPGG